MGTKAMHIAQKMRLRFVIWKWPKSCCGVPLQLVLLVLLCWLPCRIHLASGCGESSDELRAFDKRGHQVIDACDRRVRVDKWTCMAVRADWRAFLAQGWVTYAEICRI